MDYEERVLLCISHGSGTAAETEEVVVYTNGKQLCLRGLHVVYFSFIVYGNNAAVLCSVTIDAENGCTYKPEPAAVAKTENSYGSQDKNQNTNCLRGFCETGNNLILLDPLKTNKSCRESCLVMNTYVPGMEPEFLNF